jgi:transcriptional regulator GlxA family with amidase domain
LKIDATETLGGGAMHTATLKLPEPKPNRSRPEQHYRKIVDRIEDMALAQPEGPLHVDDLCSTVGVSQRTLRNAFRAVYGTPPYRYLRTLRMREARNALLSAEHPTQTVTDVATRFGFFELGRFSVEYRLAFGECPSVTLRRAAGMSEEPRLAAVAQSLG